jgi:hypothetical protein
LQHTQPNPRRMPNARVQRRSRLYVRSEEDAKSVLCNVSLGW